MPHYRVHHDPRSSHQQICTLVRERRLSPILDVGAAQGIIGYLVRDTGLPIDGVEANPHWADLARPHYRTVWATTVEEAPLPPKTYRLIVCGDVLEHVVNPVAVLKKLTEAATEDALFIVSLPNVAHLAVRLMLLFGHFPRMDRGILDRTHLHFFTRETAQAMLQDAGLRVTKISPTGIPLDELWRNGQRNPIYRLLTRLQHLMLRVAPRLFGFQWVMVAERTPAK